LRLPAFFTAKGKADVAAKAPTSMIAAALPPEVANAVAPTDPVAQARLAQLAAKGFGRPDPELPAAFLLERGLTFAAIGANVIAVNALQAAVHRDPTLGRGWRALAKLMQIAGQAEAAAEARDMAAATDTPPHQYAAPPRAALLQTEAQIRATLARAKPPRPRQQLREHLFAKPTDAAALRILAECVLEAHEPDRAEAILDRTLELAPGYTDAREDLALLLLLRSRWVEAMPHLDRLIAEEPDNEMHRIFRADAMMGVGDTQGAIDIFEAIIKRGTFKDPRLTLMYGHALREIGRRLDCLRAYRACTAHEMVMGEAYWGLANLKFEPLTDDDIAVMRKRLENPDMDPFQRTHFNFALGHALEQSRDFAGSFAAYSEGARVRRENLEPTEIPYNADALTEFSARQAAYFTAERLAARARPAEPGAVPIFIVGMPRSGSTLVEQILASHSLIEGLQELPELNLMVAQLDARGGRLSQAAYPECLDACDSAALAALGAEYLARCAAYRRTDKPYFIDKMPGNWTNIGFIRLILPQAKIIDARRHPMAACLGTFKQLIIGGGNYSYRLSDIGRRWRDYQALTAHFDTILPGLVHRVQYEDMVEDSEREIRRLLTYCGVEFEPHCVRFWETERTVRTPSATQVRRPITRDSLAQWRNFEPFLDELREALGPALPADSGGRAPG